MRDTEEECREVTRFLRAGGSVPYVTVRQWVALRRKTLYYCGAGAIRWSEIDSRPVVWRGEAVGEDVHHTFDAAWRESRLIAGVSGACALRTTSLVDSEVWHAMHEWIEASGCER